MVGAVLPLTKSTRLTSSLRCFALPSSLCSRMRRGRNQNQPLCPSAALRTFLAPAGVTSEILKVPVVLLPQVVGVLVAGGVLLWVYVEALRVPGEPDGRDDGAPVPPAEDVVPVHAPEEGMLLDPLGAAAHVAQPAGPVRVAEGPDYVLRLWRDRRLLWEYDGLLDDPVMRSWLVIGKGGGGYTLRAFLSALLLLRGTTYCLYISIGF